MGVQTEILGRIETTELASGVNHNGTVGILALGKPGDILAKAFGPLVFAEVPASGTYTFGTYVTGKGILVNSNDSAFYGASAAEPFGYTITLKAGMQAAFMQYGIAVVLCRDLANIVDNMNAKVLDGYDPTKTYGADSKDVCSVEVMGLKANDSVVALTITAPTNGTITGATTGDKFVKGASVKLTAVPASGYTFTKWGDNTTDNPKTFVLNADTTVSATFGAE